jgi:hypothetical protein
LRIVIGLKAHSGWAALIVLGFEGNEWHVIERRRVELVEAGKFAMKQPYHAAEGLSAADAKKLVERAVKSARRIAVREMRALVKRVTAAGHKIAGCAVLVGSPMPGWTIDQIRSVHVRMHKAEGVLFPEALTSAAAECDLKVTQINEKTLNERAAASLEPEAATKTLTALGRSIGPPWGRDQKSAALAAMVVWEERSK